MFNEQDSWNEKESRRAILTRKDDLHQIKHCPSPVEILCAKFIHLI